MVEIGDMMILIGILGFLLGGGVVAVWMLRQKNMEVAFSKQQEQLQQSLWQERIDEREKRLVELRQEHLQLQQVNDQLRSEVAQLRDRYVHSESQREAQVTALQEKVELLKKAEEILGNTFKALSAEALKANNQSFVEMANLNLQRFQELASKDLQSRQETIQSMVDPLKQSLVNVNEKIETLEKARVGAYVGLTEQIKTLLASQSKLEGETSQLSRALRSPSVRGRWGEMQLKRTVELAGMLDHVDFIEQSSVSTEDALQRPDMMVHLPNGREVIIDAKVPLAAYLDSLEASDPDKQRDAIKLHARHIRDHLQMLGSKAYWKQFESTPEFVVLFLPGEVFFSAALQEDPDLIDFGLMHRTLLATPTTLIALLKAVAYGWKQDDIAKEAKNIHQLGRELYGRMCSLAGHFLDLKKGLDRAVGSYNKAMSSLDSRILPTARKFEALGFETDEKLPNIELVEAIPLMSRSEEFNNVLSDAMNNADKDCSTN